MIERADADLPISAQAALLSLSRSSLYYVPRPPSLREVLIKHRMDELFTDDPCLGARRLAHLLGEAGYPIDRKTVRAYMREMGLEAIYPKPHLSKPAPEHKIYPYLLRGVSARYPDHIWGVDITYVRLLGGWMYLVAILDWYSRYIVSWELDQTLEIGFVLCCLDRALDKATPAISNSDQGSHFTSPQFVERLLEKQVAISMDGRGRAMDNIFTERLWRTVKYEEVYLHDYETPRQARQSLARYLTYYNERRPHQALGYRTPAQVYFGTKPQDPQKGEESNLKIVHPVS
jgi:putative transposase